MKRGSTIVRFVCLATALAGAVFSTACVHRTYRAYDPYYNDYHKWDDREVGVYQQWARETHRDPDRDFRKLPPDEQEEYWKWRHDHAERGKKRHKHDQQ